MKNFSGIFTALVTPFKSGKIDFDSLERLLEFQITQGIDGFVINGTTAESPNISSSERAQLFRFIKERVPDKYPLIMGTGTNSTEQSKQQAIEAEKFGADACLVVVPYYNKPPQRGIFEHFIQIANATDLPIILYNVPSRTIVALELETIKKLAEHPRIIGIKEASGNIEFARNIRKSCGEEFLLLSGDDSTYDQFMDAGGDGAISVASHIIPQAIKDQKIRENQELIGYLFCEANPIPVKMALYLMKLIDSPELRLPLIALAKDKTEELKNLMMKAGLL